MKLKEKNDRKLLRNSQKISNFVPGKNPGKLFWGNPGETPEIIYGGFFLGFLQDFPKIIYQDFSMNKMRNLLRISKEFSINFSLSILLWDYPNISLKIPSLI